MRFHSRAATRLRQVETWTFLLAVRRARLMVVLPMGKLIPHSGGLRKLRWAAGGRGQRGGLRVIYYWWVGDRLISLLAIYAKNRKADLTVAEIRQLREIIEGE